MKSMHEILNTIDEREPEAVEPIPENALAHLRSVYRDPTQPDHRRDKCAMAALPFESPKLIATANISAEDFANRLERAITRSSVGVMRLIEHKPE
jgi:hypothetical protein